MEIKEVDFTTHAEEKLKRLMSLGVTKEKVLEIVRNPEKIVYGLWKKNCTRFINCELMLRVVYEENEKILVITVYPCRRERYK
jgi:hypothetical protein